MYTLPISQKKLYWLLQCSGWSVLFFYDILKWFGLRSNYTLESVLFLLLYYGSALFISHGLRFIYLKVLERNIKAGYILLIIIVLTYLVSWISMFLQFGIDVAEYVYIFEARTLQEQIDRFLSVRMYLYTLFFQPQYIMWSFAYLGIKMWLDVVKQKKETEDAINFAKDAQLKMLTYQLNPHFLFNSLNSIQVLIDENKEVAKETVGELSEILRYSLLNSELKFQPLKEELKIIKQYLSIEKKRYEHNVHISYNVSDEAQEYSVINFLLQPFIENAIKFGMKTSDLPLEVCIKALVEKNVLKIEIENSGKWYEKDPEDEIEMISTGNGILNIRKRLEYIYPNKHKIEIFEEKNTVKVRMAIEK